MAYLRVSFRFFSKGPREASKGFLNNSHGKMHPESLKSIKPLALYSTFWLKSQYINSKPSEAGTPYFQSAWVQI